VDLLHEIRQRAGAGNLISGENELLGYKRISANEARKNTPPPKESAVLFPLFQRNGEWHTAFIQRPSGSGIHSGQLSFPGGKIESGETSDIAAMRETEEEIGIHASSIQIECGLSEIYIPPSNFIVQPFVGLIAENPFFTANEAEVQQIIEYPVLAFLRNDIIVQREVYIAVYQKEMTVNCFDIHGFTLWGATAMMVQEFRSAMGFKG
jgi:8-oxo-dGTP pyrophosphatase MutT (NUDIX family)